MHRWSVVLEEFNFTVHHRPGRAQTQVDGLSQLPVEQAPPEEEETTLIIQPLTDEATAHQVVWELHNTTYVGAEALWKLFRDHFSFSKGKCICSEVAKSCIHCQAGTDYGAQKKTFSTIVSDGLWDTLYIDIVGPPPADWRMEYIISFMGCFSKYSILITLKDHTALTVSNALLDQVILYFGIPQRLLSDRGQEFTGQVCEELLKALGIQWLLTSPYHPEGNAINELRHRTMNNMLLTLYDGTLAPHWVDKIPAINP